MPIVGKLPFNGVIAPSHVIANAPGFFIRILKFTENPIGVLKAASAIVVSPVTVYKPELLLSEFKVTAPVRFPPACPLTI